MDLCSKDETYINSNIFNHAIDAYHKNKPRHLSSDIAMIELPCAINCGLIINGDSNYNFVRFIK